MSLCLVLSTRHKHMHSIHKPRQTHTQSDASNSYVKCRRRGGGSVVPDQYVLSHSDCIIIILMTAVFSPVMAFEMNKTTPEVSKSSLLLQSARGCSQMSHNGQWHFENAKLMKTIPILLIKVSSAKSSFVLIEVLLMFRHLTEKVCRIDQKHL